MTSILLVFGIIGLMVFLYTKYYLGLPTEIEQILSSKKKGGRLVLLVLVFGVSKILDLSFFQSALLLSTTLGSWSVIESFLLKTNRIPYGDEYGWSALGSFLQGIGMLLFPFPIKLLLENPGLDPTETLNQIFFWAPIILVLYGSLLSEQYDGLIARIKQSKRYQKHIGRD